MKMAATLLAQEEGVFNPLLPHTYELVVGVFAFLVVFFVVGRMLVPRIQKTLAERTDAIEGGIKRAEEAQAQAMALQKEYREQLAEARHEAARLREEAREQAAQIKAELREEAQARFDARTTESIHRGAVGLVVARLEDEEDPRAAGDLGEPPGLFDHVILDHAGPGDEEKRPVVADLVPRDLHCV